MSLFFNAPLTFLTLPPAGGGALPVTYWLATAYEGGGTTDGVLTGEIEVDSTGNMYVLSSMDSTTYGTDGRDFVLTKLNAAGEFQWHKLLAGSATGGSESISLISSGGCLAIDGDDNLIIGQTAQDRNGSLVYTGFVTKISPAGSIIWQKIQDSGGTDQSRAYAVTVDQSTNDIYVCGEMQGAVGGTTYGPYVVKYNSSGTEQWQMSFGTTGGNQNVKGLTLDTNGDVLVSGQNRSGSTRGAIAKLSKSTGAISWSRYIGNTTNNKGLNHMAMDGDDPIMVGFNQQNSSGSNDLWVVKYNNSGTYQWGRLLGGSANDQGYAIATDDSGNVYVGGFQSSDVAHTSVTQTVLLAKYNSSGTIQWQKRFTADNNSGNINRITGIRIHPDGSLILAISSYNGAGSDYSIQVMKLPIDDTLWPSTVGDWSIATSSLTDKAASSTEGSLSYTTQSTNSITSSAGAMTISNPSASFTEVKTNI